MKTRFDINWIETLLHAGRYIQCDPLQSRKRSTTIEIGKFWYRGQELSKTHNSNSNGLIQKFINGLKLIHSKVRDASTSKDDPSSSASKDNPSAFASTSKDEALASASKDPSASTSKKAEKECFLKNLFKKEVNPDPELEPE
ncbi:unnamed protein product [Prunus armeniaca]|uniref:Uncharacterized protein n=1 Tax=Prunus armeniaca TaxID=36596 RepID=A0A6J5VMG1_PRUAR|nr:unnamed protein product [Prunus armeniaca]CAB4319429.1 unnamed protein product [Prunus armeniaca]